MINNKLIVKEAYHIKQNNAKLLVFSGYDKYELKKNDILSDGINEYKITGFEPNLIQDILTVTVESDKFNKDELIGKELNFTANLREQAMRILQNIPENKMANIINMLKMVK